LIVPDIEWKKTLRPTIDKDKIDAYNGLKDKGFIIAPSRIGAAAGLDWKEEALQAKKETDWLKEQGLIPEKAEGEVGGETGGDFIGGETAPGGQTVTDGLPGVPASKETPRQQEREKERKEPLKFTDHRNKKDREELFLVGDGNKEAVKRGEGAIALEAEADGFGIVAQFETPDIDQPQGYESREDWQKALHNSKIPQEAKNHIKAVENLVVDGWEHSFDGLWKHLAPQFEQQGAASDADINNMLVESVLDHLKKMDVVRFDNDLTGVFHNGKIHSYDAFDFAEHKRKKHGFIKEAVTIDSMEDDMVLRGMKERLKAHLVKLTNEDLKRHLAEKVSKAMQEAVEKSASADDLKRSLSKVYSDALWRLQQAVRVETTNNFTVASLLGYKEQGIKKSKWNAHNDHKTCPLCRGYNGLEFDVDYLLSLGPYPLVKMTHHQCRCWLTAVTGHIDWTRREKDLLTYRTKFQEPAKVEYPVKTTKTFKALKSEFKNAPVEHEKSIKSVRSRLSEANYGELWPKNVEFVGDVSESPAFVNVFGKREDLKGRVQYWKDASGKVWVSNFYLKDKDPNTGVVRLWADNIYPKVRPFWENLYSKKMAPKRVADLQESTVSRISDILKPIPIVIPFRVGGVQGISLNKKFRELAEQEAREMLANAGVGDVDINTIVNWRGISPSWSVGGKVIEVGAKDLQQEGFVNELAKRSAKDLFVESASTYVGDGFLLQFRDPESYKHLKDTIFRD